MNIEELFKEAVKLNESVKVLLKQSMFENYDDLSGIDYEREAEQLLLVDELKGILTKLQDASYTISYLEKPVKAEGVLHKAENGRYKLHSENSQYHGYEFSSGTGIEYLAEDDYHAVYSEKEQDYVNIPYWRVGTIEHNGTHYYITGASSGLELENLRVRIR